MLLSTPAAPENRNNIKLKTVHKIVSTERAVATYKYKYAYTKPAAPRVIIIIIFRFYFLFSFLAFLFCFLFCVSRTILVLSSLTHSLLRSLAHQSLSSALALAHSVSFLRKIVMYLYVAYLCFGISEIAQRNLESTEEKKYCSKNCFVFGSW